LSLNAITKHLKLLERAGLVSREKQGREVLISFRPEPLFSPIEVFDGWLDPKCPGTPWSEAATHVYWIFDGRSTMVRRP
jgi:DNA-binding transcriptional ArsR family regulator